MLIILFVTYKFLQVDTIFITDEETEVQKVKLLMFAQLAFCIANKLKKIEDKLNINNEELKELRSEYVEAIAFFTERQKERNKYARARRTAETNYRNHINKSIKLFEEINKNEVKEIQDFLHTENEKTEKEIVELLSKNGKSERVPFFSKVLENAAKERTKITC